MSYLLFAGFSYYASGGMNDYQGNFATLEDAMNHLSNVKLDYGESPDWYQIVDASDISVIEHKGYVYNNRDKYCTGEDDYEHMA